jgi:hypothetical protein
MLLGVLYLGACLAWLFACTFDVMIGFGSAFLQYQRTPRSLDFGSMRACVRTLGGRLSAGEWGGDCGYDGGIE